MGVFQCPNAECSSQGPFQVTEAPSANGRGHHKVVQCMACGAIVGVLELDRPEGFPDKYAKTLVRLEASVRSIASGLTHLRGQLANLQGKIAHKS